MKWIWALIGLMAISLAVWRVEESKVLHDGPVILGKSLPEVEATLGDRVLEDLETTTIVRMPPEIIDLLNQAESMELISLDPNVQKPDRESAFHGVEVLGRMYLTDSTSRSLIAEEVVRGTELIYTPNEDGSIVVTATLCAFFPRHGIRVTSGGETIDLVICYECGDMHIHKNDEKVVFVETSTMTPVLMNQMLREAGLKMDDPEGA